MSMSVGAELQATAARLRQATATGDATQMQAALDAAAPAAMMDGPGAAEVQQLAMEIASRLSTDENLRRSVNLRRSQNVRAKVRRMWDLMVVESAAIALEAEPEASAAGYKLGADGPLEGIRSAPSGSPRGAEPAASQSIPCSCNAAATAAASSSSSTVDGTPLGGSAAASPLHTHLCEPPSPPPRG
jgi:hypothetical protein